MEAQVGYDAGDYINYYTVPGSMTPSIVDIETTSNVGIPGMYIFQVDGNYTGMSSAQFSVYKCSVICLKHTRVHFDIWNEWILKAALHVLRVLDISWVSFLLE